MKLIELYLEEIRHYLPPKNREDILKEIRSALMDMIEDRNPNPGQEPDETLVKEVLKEFGSPREVAQQYGTKTYLIGPRIYPVYLQVLQIVLIVVAAFNVVGVVIAIVSQSGVNPNMFEAILEVVGGLFSSLFTAFGIVTLSFAGIERTTPDEWKVSVEHKWDPDQLLKEQDKERIKIAELAIEITLSLVFIVVLNFFLDKIGIYYLDESGWSSAPILNDNFLRYIPWITAYSVLGILLDLYLARAGYWDKIATIGKVFINLFTIAVSFVIITGPAVITVSETALRSLNFDLAITANRLSEGLNTGLDIVLGLAIFGLVVESIRRVYRTFIKGQSAGIEIDLD